MAKRTHPRGLSFVDDRNTALFKGVSDSSGLSIVESVHRRTRNQGFKVRPSAIPKGHHFNVFSGDQGVRNFGIASPAPPSQFELLSNDFDDCNLIWQGVQDFRSATACI
jgi:hypothetical protein